MKGYYTSNGFYGYVNGQYQYFGSQSDYYSEMERSSDWIPECNMTESQAKELWV